MRRRAKKTAELEPLWTKPFIGMMLISLLASTAMNVQLATLPLYMRHIGGNESSAGLMTGAFTIAAFLTRPLFGDWIDRKGRRAILIVGITGSAAAALTYPFIGAVWLLLLIRFIHGVSFSASSTSAGTMIADILPPRRLMEGIGLSGLSGTLAVAFGPAIGLYVVNRLENYTLLYILTFLFSACGLVIACFLRETTPALHSTPVQPVKRPKRWVLEKTALPTSLIAFFVAMPQGCIITFLPAFGLSRGIESIGLFFTVSAGAMLVSRMVCGRISDRYGPTVVILPGFLLGAVALTLLPFAASLPFIMLVGALYGLGFGTVQPLLNAMTIKRCPPERRGAGNATFMVAMDAGYAAGSIVIGLLLQATGYSTVYMSSAGFMLLAALCYLLMIRKPQRNPNKELQAND
ncbi:MFS transporter [Paenibacillus donghaensis]|uniref:Major facilitator superfamily (MFS) profile domain-containing protein n=1 Tax=Paenibacillus donghaensis TaxID=414771 RepID=A0A2Z2K3B8_9BACL|nr:hypothetical protein B9T62_02435 [Paenibacillus donghaensis]